MSKTKVLFLGTGTSQGVPVIGCNCFVCQSSNFKDKRLRSSVIFSINQFNILIDIGPDFRYQMLRNNFSNIDAVLLTHHHRDHTAGLDDIRPIYYLNKNPIEMYAEKKVFQSIQTDFQYLFSGVEYPGKPKFRLHHITNSSFFISNIEIIPIRAFHYKLPVLGFRIGDITYITDANSISELEKKKIKGTKILIINSLKKEKHISHFNLKEALSIINEISPERAYLTHISHEMGLHETVQKELPKNVFLSYDNLHLSL